LVDTNTNNKFEVKSGASEGWAVPVLLMAPVVFTTSSC